MNKLFLLLLLMFFSSNSFGFTEASCPNCSESQARAKARSVAPSTDYQMHRVYVHDLETPAFRSYDVWHETEEEMTITLVTNAEIPTGVQDDWDTVLTVQTVVIHEPFDPIVVAPGEFRSAYDAINNNIALDTIFHDGIEARGIDTTLGVLTGVAATLSSKIVNVQMGVTYTFADGSTITMSITSYNLKTNVITVEFQSARSNEDQPIYQDPSALVGSTVTTNVSADAFFDYLDRNDVSMVDISGNLLTSIQASQTGGWVCYGTPTGAECRFEQN